MKPEQGMWQKYSPMLAKYAHLWRVENMLFTGTPDVNYCLLGGDEGWIENKCLESIPTSTLAVCLKHYTDAQRRWAKQRSRVGGTVWFFLRIKSPVDTWILIPGAKAALLYDASDTRPLSDLRAVASWWHEGPLKPSHMPGFVTILRNRRV